MEDSGKASQAQAGDAGRGQDLQWGRHGPHHRGLQYQARDGNFLLFPLTVESVLHIQLLPRPGGSPRQGVPNPEGPHTPWKEAAASVFSVTTQGCQPGVAGPFVFAKGKSESWMSMRTQNLSRLAPTWARGVSARAAGAVGDCQQGVEELGVLSTLTSGLGRIAQPMSVRTRGCSLGQQGPWLPGGIWFPAASLHGARGIWNHLGAPVPASLRARESERLFSLVCDGGGPGEKG